MITIESDQPALGEALKSLVSQVVQHGGWIHDDLLLIAENGSIRAESRLPEGRDDLLVLIPEELLLPLDEVSLRIHDDEIVVESFSEGATPVRRHLFETMFQIYNLCGKIRSHRAVSPCFVFDRKSEISNILGEARDPRKEDATDPDEAFLEDFLHSRLFSFTHGSVAGGQEVLMPVVDFFNHHPAAPAFVIESSRIPDRPVIGVNHWKTRPDSHECFVRYSHFDAFDLFNGYGYLERECGFVRSVPLVIDLGETGRIHVRSAGSAFFKDELPTRLMDLRNWMPLAIRGSDRELGLSHLIIPGRTDRSALRRVLATMIASWQPGMDLERVAEFVAIAERQVLEKNVRYYEKLSECLANNENGESDKSLIEAAREMALSQLTLLANYEFED